MSRHAGFTLVEVMAVTALLAVFTAAAATLSTHLFGSHRLGTAYTNDVLDAQRALRALRRDLGAASRVFSSPGAPVGLRLASGAGEIAYRLEGGVLRRVENGTERVLARNVARLVTAVEGRLAHVRLELGHRADGPKRRTAAIATSVRMRTESEE